MKQVYVGKIINTFGIKGELKVASSFEFKEKAFIKNNKIYLNNEEFIITSVRFHKTNYLIEINNLKDINEVLKYKGLNLYINRDDLNLGKDEYLSEDLINLDVYGEDNLIGKVTDVYLGSNPLIRVDNKFYIPLKGDFIIKIDFADNKLICQNLKGLIL